MTLSPTAERAAALYHRGRAMQACRAFAEVLAKESPNGEICRLYGLALRDTGQTDAAVEQFKYAVMLDRDEASMKILAETLHLAGALEEARQCYEALLARMPDSVECLRDLASVLVDLQQNDAASAVLDRVLSQTPEDARTLTLFGKVGLRLGFVAAARAAALKAVPFVPDEHSALCQLADLLCQLEQEEEGLALYDRALMLDPRSVPVLGNRGAALLALGRPKEALISLQKANGLRPNTPPVLQLLIQAFRTLGNPERAEFYCAQALRLQPGSRNARAHQASLLMDRGRIAESLAAIRALRADHPEDAELERFEALLLLLTGAFEEGWAKLESRMRFGVAGRLAEAAAPGWNGEALEGRRVLITAEEGFGDAIQFVRYARNFAERGALVGVRAPAALHRLLAGAACVSAVHAEVEKPAEHYDFDVRLLSLPRLFETKLDSIPGETPYFSVAEPDVARWRRRLDEDGAAALRVGFVWAGNPKHRNDHNRSIAWSAMAPLVSVPGVAAYSLQVGAAREAYLAEPRGVIDLAPALADYYETAAAISALDLVITVDTSVAHLAGALGRPVWTLLPFAPDWRWLMERADSPWYPSMRLFRQPAFADWPSAIARAREALVERTDTACDQS